MVSSSSTKQQHQVVFEKALIVPKRGNSIPVTHFDITIDGKLVLFHLSRRSFKASELVQIESNPHAKDKEGKTTHVVTIQTTKPGQDKLICTNPILTTNQQKTSWTKWLKKMQVWEARNREATTTNSEEEPSTTNNKEPRRRSVTPIRRASHTATRHAAGRASTGSTTFPHRTNRMPRGGRHSLPSSSRKSFARNPTTLLSPKRPTSDWLLEETGASKEQDAGTWSKPSSGKQEQEEEEEEEEDMALDDNNSSVENHEDNDNTMQTDPPHAASSSPLKKQGDAMSEDEDIGEFSDPDENELVLPSQTSRTKRQHHRRILDDDSDEEEEEGHAADKENEAADNPIVSLSSQDVSSPIRPTVTTIKPFDTTKETVAASSSSTLETKENAAPQPDKNQPKISGFFAPRTAVRRSFDPSRNHTPNPSQKQPLRALTSPRRLSPKVVRHTNTTSHNSSTSKYFQQDTSAWIKRSRAGSRSPSKVQSQSLFGEEQPWNKASTPNRNKSESMEVLERSIGEYSPEEQPTIGTQTPVPAKLILSEQDNPPLHPPPSTLSLSCRKRRRHSLGDTPLSLAPKSPHLRWGTSAAPSSNLTTTNNNNTTLTTDSLTTAPRPRHRGLRNLGNTCFVNATLQMLALWGQTRLVLPPSESLVDSETPLTQTLMRIIQQLLADPTPTGSQPLSSVVLNPVALKKTVDLKTDRFLGYEQRDAHEFLSVLLDLVHEELETANNQRKKSLGDDSAMAVENQDGLPTDDFHFMVQTSLQCTSCNYTRSREELYQHLSIDLPTKQDISGKGDVAQIADSLDSFFQPEELELRCEKCAHGTHVRKTLKIVSRYV